MELIPFAIFFGVMFGIGAALLWLSVAAIFGLMPPTQEQLNGIVGLFAIISPVGALAFIFTQE